MSQIPSELTAVIKVLKVTGLKRIIDNETGEKSHNINLQTTLHVHINPLNNDENIDENGNRKMKIALDGHIGGQTSCSFNSNLRGPSSPQRKPFRPLTHNEREY